MERKYIQVTHRTSTVMKKDLRTEHEVKIKNKIER